MAVPTVPYTIFYANHEADEPIFVAGSFSDPPWRPQQMRLSLDERNRRVFVAELDLQPGKEYQYKLRIGEGDDWVLSEAHSIVEDDLGNQNNLLKVPLDHTKQTNHMVPALTNKQLQISPIYIRSGTPIEQVASTAAEVADTARDLDRDQDHSEFALDTTDSYDRMPEIKSPLLSHECLGPYTLEAVDDEVHTSQHDAAPRTSTKTLHGYLLDDSDINDPTLEKFPSDRTAIMDALRRISSSLSDRPTLDDLSPSPRGRSADGSRSDSIESVESIPTPGSLNPTSARKRDSRPSHGSIGRSRSTVSLTSIAEEGSKPKPELGPGNALGLAPIESTRNRKASDPTASSVNLDPGLQMKSGTRA